MTQKIAYWHHTTRCCLHALVFLWLVLFVNSNAFAVTAEDGFNRPNTPRWVFAQQADGKLISARFGRRSNANGTLDESFVFEPFGTSTSAVVLPAGKLLLGGIYGVAQVNSDGTPDASFSAPVIVGIDSPTSEPLVVFATATDAQGRILIAGRFVSIDGVARQNLARLNPDGTLDESFASASFGGSFPVIFDLEILDDGDILVGGWFDSVNGQGQAILAQFSPTGLLRNKSFFSVATGASFVSDIDLDRRGRITVVGKFTGKNAMVAYPPASGNIFNRGITRFLADGTSDPEFFNPAPTRGFEIHSVEIRDDAKMFIQGSFEGFGHFSEPAIERMSLALLNEDGSVDESFESDRDSTVFEIGGINSSSRPRQLFLQSDGKLLVPDSNPLNNTEPLFRLNEDATLDTDFNPGANGNVFAFSVQADHKIVVAGEFTEISGNARNGIARLNADGSLDTTFDENGMTSGGVAAIATLTDGSTILAGVLGSARGPLTRFLASGEPDTNFTPAPNGTIESLLALPGDRILVAGSFSQIGGVARQCMAILNKNGAVDMSFIPALEACSFSGSRVRAVARQADGKYLIVGSFSFSGSEFASDVLRLNANGSLDSTFAVDLDAGASSIIALPDGKILVSGSFSTANGATRNRIARLRADGTTDSLFTTEPGDLSSIFSMTLQVDGKIVIVGDFLAVGGEPRRHIARLFADGAIEPGFDPGTPNSNLVVTLMPEESGRVILGGTFSDIDGQARNRIARIAPDEGGNEQLVLDTENEQLTWLRTGISPELSSVALQTSVDALSWQNLGELQRIGSTANWQTSLDVTSLGSELRFVRVVGIYGNSDSSSVLDSILALPRAEAPAEELCVPIVASNGNIAVVCL